MPTKKEAKEAVAKMLAVKTPFQVRLKPESDAAPGLHLNCVRRPLQVFQQFDVDGSGAIDFDEFTAMLVRMHGRFPPLHSSPRVADCASQQKALHINISYGCELCAVTHSPLHPL